MPKDKIPDHWRVPIATLAFSLASENLVIVVGAGLSVPSGLPTWNDLCRAMLEEMGQEVTDQHDGPFIAELYEQQFGREALTAMLGQRLAAGEPSAAHRLLAELPIAEFHTTNYDGLVEAALREAGKEPLVVSDESGFGKLSDASVRSPAVIKLNGGIENPDRIVVTEADFAEYSISRPNLMAHAIHQLKLREMLFLGVSFKDPWIRYMRDKSRADLRGDSRRRYVLSQEIGELAKKAYRHLGLDVVEMNDWCELPEFLKRLQNAVSQERASRGTSRSDVATEAYQNLLIEVRQLADSKWKLSLDEIVEAANSGLHTEALANVRALIEEMDTSDTTRPSAETLAAAHRVAAQLALISRTPDQTDQAAEHIRTAEQLQPSSAETEGLVRAKAELHIARGDVQRGLDMLRGLSDPKSRLALFIAYLEAGHAGAAEQMVETGAIDLSKAETDDDVARAATLYYGLRGDNDKARLSAELLLADGVDGRKLLVAATGLQQAALGEYAALCDKYRMPYGVPVFLNPAELIDKQSQTEAVEYLVRATRWYMENAAPLQAEQTARDATRLAIAANLPNAAAQVFGAIAEDDITRMVAAATWPGDQRFSTNAPSHAELEEMLQLSKAPPSALLKSISLAATRASDAAPLTHLLWTYRERFQGEAVMHLEWGRNLSGLCSIALANGRPVRVDGRALTPLTVIAELRPPAEFAWFPAILECKAYLNATPRSDDVLEKAKNSVARAEELALPDNPEVLLASHHVAFEQREYALRVQRASRLVEVIPAAETAKLLLYALLDNQEWERFLQELADALERGDIDADSVAMRNMRAVALMKLNRDGEATDDLRWIFEHPRTPGSEQEREIIEQAVANLIYIYRIRGEYEEARRITEEAHRKLGEDKPDFLIALAHVLLDMGKGDEAFGVLKGGAQRFGGDRAFDVALHMVSFRSGHEGDPVAREAGARVYSAPEDDYMRRVQVPTDGTLGELGDILREQAERARMADTGYGNGALPFVALAYSPGFRKPACQLWWKLGHFGGTRYVALGNQAPEIHWLAENSPPGVVMDYTTLLFLDELIPQEMGGALDFVARFFETVYLPASLRPVLDLEARALASAVVQPSRVRSARETERQLRASGKLHKIAHVEDQQDPTGEVTARGYAGEHNLVFVTAYATHHAELSAQAASVRDFVRWLCAMGVVGRDAVAGLTGRQLGDVPGTPPDWDRMRAGKAVVMDGTALEVLHDVEALQSVLEWVEAIHVPSINIEGLLGIMAYADWTANCRRRFDALRSDLERRTDVVKWISLNDEDRELKRDSDGDGEWRPIWDYFFDLFNVAIKTGAPLWTDDRVTRALPPEEHVVPRFGTDTLLAHLHRSCPDNLPDDEWAGLMGRLTKSGVRSLTIDPEYLAWAVRKAGLVR